MTTRHWRDVGEVDEQTRLRAESIKVHRERELVYAFIEPRFVWTDIGPGLVRAGYFDPDFQTLIEQTRELPLDASAEYVYWDKVNSIWWCVGQRMKRQWEAGQR